jgi:predicted enzyme related to lactoylglutathione lyase
MGKDGAKLQSFYGQLFDWDVKTDNPSVFGSYGLVSAADAGVGGGIGPGEPTGVTFYVEVPDLEAALAKVEQLGGRTLTSPMEMPGIVTFATFADPEGNRIGLVKG